ncbi:MAG: hypothetical protein KHY83_08985 [Coriobacteriia bacterium]|nr:hypothetical protein [Coriobacteriia bacterium]MBS5478780.1 hypothetical protein [Coriobacteriia bacterium]
MEGEVLPIVAGALCGAAGGAPYLVAFAYAKRAHGLSVLPALVAVGASVLIVAVSLLGAYVLARSAMAPFTIAFVALFFVMVIIGAVWFLKKPRPDVRSK